MVILGPENAHYELQRKLKKKRRFFNYSYIVLILENELLLSWAYETTEAPPHQCKWEVEIQYYSFHPYSA